MTSHSVRASAGTRVQIRLTVLQAAERAENLPSETRQKSYEMRVRGRLKDAARVGEVATIITAIGREIQGQLEAIEPEDSHTFGSPPPALCEAIYAIEALRDSV